MDRHRKRRHRRCPEVVGMLLFLGRIRLDCGLDPQPVHRVLRKSCAAMPYSKATLFKSIIEWSCDRNARRECCAQTYRNGSFSRVLQQRSATQWSAAK